MEFYSTMKKNEVFLFVSKQMELERSFWVRLSRLRRPKIVCSPSYVDFRSRGNTAMWVHLGPMIRGEHTQEVWG
jgi:hypothetical protein